MVLFYISHVEWKRSPYKMDDSYHAVSFKAFGCPCPTATCTSITHALTYIFRTASCLASISSNKPIQNDYIFGRVLFCLDSLYLVLLILRFYLVFYNPTTSTLCLICVQLYKLYGSVTIWNSSTIYKIVSSIMCNRSW